MKTTYTLFETSTGTITRSISTDLATLLLNVGDDESYIDGDYPGDQFRIVDGAAVAVDPEPPPWRETRDWLLAASDYTQLPDVYFNAGVKSQWATYRQQLRDMTGGETWPTPPNT